MLFKNLSRFRELGEINDLSLFLIRNVNEVNQDVITDLLNNGYKPFEIIGLGLEQCVKTLEHNQTNRYELFKVYRYLVENELPINKVNLNKFAHLSGNSARRGFGYQTMNKFIKVYRDEIKIYHEQLGMKKS